MLRIAVFYKMIRSQLFVKRMAVFNDEDGIFLIQYNECSFLWLGWHLSFGKCRWLAWSPVLSSDCNQPIQYFIIFTLHNTYMHSWHTVLRNSFIMIFKTLLKVSWPYVSLAIFQERLQIFEIFSRLSSWRAEERRWVGHFYCF